jgi:hypothetical protein
LRGGGGACVVIVVCDCSVRVASVVYFDVDFLVDGRLSGFSGLVGLGLF